MNEPTNTLALSEVADLGKLIRTVRIQAGLAQADAAALCGVSAPFLVGLERGKPTVRLALVLQVCRGLGIGLLAHPPVSLSRLEQQPQRRPRRDRGRLR